MESILHSIKQLLGVNPEYTFFDEELIMHINAVFMILSQLGVGPANGFSITSSTEKWEDFLGEDISKLELVKSYVYLKVRMMWDSGITSATVNSLNNMIQEYEWRLNVRAESEVTPDE